MPRVNRLGRQLRSLIWRTPVADEVNADLDLHVEMRTHELVGRGLDPVEARAQALRRFGDIGRVKQQCVEIAERREKMMRVEEWMDDWRQDLRIAWRQLAARPGFTLALVLTLALGIGANATVFSAVDSVLFRPLPYAEPGSLVTLWQTEPDRAIEKDNVSPGNFLEWRDRSTTVARMAEIEPYSMDLTGQGDPQNLPTWLVSERFFEIMGVPPLLGRTFRSEEHDPGAAEDAGPRRPGGRVVVLAHGLWVRTFGGDTSIIGRSLTLDDQAYQVVGIMPAGFTWPPGREVWRPRIISEDERESRSRNWLRVVARLQPNATIGEAQADLTRVANQLAAEHPDTNRGSGVLVQGLREHITGPVRTPLLVLFGAVAFVLLIACTNVAGLLLARGSQRQRELAVRAALGAGRGRLARQLLAEAGLYGLLGALAGLLLAYWGIRGLDVLAAGQFPRVESLALDGRVLAFAVSISVATVLLFGLGPALKFSRPDLQSSLKEGGRAFTPGRGRVRVHSLLVAGQIALTLVLVAGAGLLARSFVGLTSVNPGFEVENRLAVSLHIWDKYPEPEERADYFREALERISALPGVVSAGAASSVPFGRSSIEMERQFVITDRPEPEPGREPLAFVNYVTPGYLEALGAGLLNGRMIEPGDRVGTRLVALISAGVAQRYWPGGNPVGRSIVIPGELRRQHDRRSDEFEDSSIEIVGVVADIRHDRLDTDPWAEIYLSQPQDGYGSMTIVARTAGPPAEALESVTQALYEMNPSQTLYSADTLPSLLSESLRERSFNLVLLAAFALMSLILSGVGIYGLVSFTTQQRSGEIGVRKALGAGSSDILGLVLRRTLTLASTGIIAGLGASLALTRFLRSMLYGVGTTDPVTLIVVALILGTVAALATLVPASRAAAVDPMEVLRAE